MARGKYYTIDEVMAIHTLRDAGLSAKRIKQVCDSTCPRPLDSIYYLCKFTTVDDFIERFEPTKIHLEAGDYTTEDLQKIIDESEEK